MFKTKILSNGLTIITAPMRGTKTVTALVMVGTGSKYEAGDINGLSHFLEHMFFKGTIRRPTALAISSVLDGLGAEYNAFTGKEYTGYWVKVDAARLETALDILSDMLLYPRLNAAEIERERGVIIEEMNMYQDNPILYIEDLFETCLYGDTPAGWDTIGTKAVIRRVGRDDFRRYLAAQYGPRNMTVVLAGNLSRAGRAEARLISKFFSAPALNRRGREFTDKLPVRESQARPAVLSHYKKTDQAHLALGVRAYGFGHRAKLAVRLLGIILGGSMSSRLFISLRERRGLAYYVRANDEVYTDSGYLSARAGVPVDKLEEAVRIISAEFRRMKKTPVGRLELRRAKDMLAGRMAIHLEASDSVANFYARQTVMAAAAGRMPGAARQDLAIKTPEEYLRLIGGITAADIRRAANDIFQNKKANLAVIGPYGKHKKFGQLLKI